MANSNGFKSARREHENFLNTNASTNLLGKNKNLNAVFSGYDGGTATP